MHILTTTRATKKSREGLALFYLSMTLDDFRRITRQGKPSKGMRITFRRPGNGMTIECYFDRSGARRWCPPVASSKTNAGNSTIPCDQLGITHTRMGKCEVEYKIMSENRFQFQLPPHFDATPNVRQASHVMNEADVTAIAKTVFPQLYEDDKQQKLDLDKPKEKQLDIDALKGVIELVNEIVVDHTDKIELFVDSDGKLKARVVETVG